MDDLRVVSTARDQIAQFPEFVSIRHVMWAINFDSSELEPERLQLAERTGQIISSLAPEAQVHPIHIIDPFGQRFQGELPHERLDRLSPMAEFTIAEITRYADRYLRSGHIRKPFVTDCNSEIMKSATRCIARKMASWARKFHIDLIVTNYFALKGINKLIHLHFFEALLSESDLPILVVSEKMRLSLTRFSELVFPTDFSDSCKKTFDEALRWAKYLNVPVKLFHKAGPPSAPSLSSGALLFGGWSEVLPNEIDPNEFEAEAAQLCKRGEMNGVNVEYVRDHTSRSTSDAINYYCRSLKNPLLVMSGCQGPLEAGLWGSITRDVMSQSLAPVLILRE